MTLCVSQFVVNIQPNAKRNGAYEIGTIIAKLRATQRAQSAMKSLEFGPATNFHNTWMGLVYVLHCNNLPPFDTDFTFLARYVDRVCEMWSVNNEETTVSHTTRGKSSRQILTVRMIIAQIDTVAGTMIHKQLDLFRIFCTVRLVFRTQKINTTILSSW